MPGLDLPITLTIPSDLGLLSLARDFVSAACESAGFDRQTTEAIVLATHEAVSNVVRHAHRDQPEAHIHIQCRLFSDGMEICLLDEGQPFDLASVPHLPPSEIRLGGRGIFLMRTLMDELSCHPAEEGGNILRMVKRCDRS